MRSTELEHYKTFITDWDSWVPPGGRIWYNRCTDPTSDGFLVQLNTFTDELTRIHTESNAVLGKSSEIYQLTRKMVDNADLLNSMVMKSEFMSSIIDEFEKNIHQQHPELSSIYKLKDFVAYQKAYLDHLTAVFHSAAQPTRPMIVVQERLAFYSKLRDIIGSWLDMVESVHVFNKIDMKLRKTVWQGLVACSNRVGEVLIGWDASNIDKMMTPSDEVKSIMSGIFTYDIETSILTDELRELIRAILKKHKEYISVIKDTKHMINRTPDFWTSKNRLIIHDGSSDKA